MITTISGSDGSSFQTIIREKTKVILIRQSDDFSQTLVITKVIKEDGLFIAIAFDRNGQEKRVIPRDDEANKAFEALSKEKIDISIVSISDGQPTSHPYTEKIFSVINQNRKLDLWMKWTFDDSISEIIPNIESFYKGKLVDWNQHDCKINENIIFAYLLNQQLLGKMGNVEFSKYLKFALEEDHSGTYKAIMEMKPPVLQKPKLEDYMHPQMAYSLTTTSSHGWSMNSIWNVFFIDHEEDRLIEFPQMH
jgi:hypothetical protein